MSRLPYIIAKIVVKVSIIMFVISIVLNALVFINVYNSVQAPIDLINNSVATNNFVPPEVCRALTGNDTLSITRGNGLLGRLIDGDVTGVHLSAPNLGTLKDPLTGRDRNYGDCIDYKLSVTFNTKVWTLFGKAEVPVTYTTKQSAICYRKIR